MPTRMLRSCYLSGPVLIYEHGRFSYNYGNIRRTVRLLGLVFVCRLQQHLHLISLSGFQGPDEGPVRLFWFFLKWTPLEDADIASDASRLDP